MMKATTKKSVKGSQNLSPGLRYTAATSAATNLSDVVTVVKNVS